MTNSTLKMYLTVAKMQLLEYFEYRARITIWSTIDILRIAVFPFIWIAVLQDSTVEGFDAGGIITYFIGIYLISSVVYVHGSPYISQDIRDGLLSNFLVKPIAYLAYMNVMDFMGKNVKQIILLPFIVVVTWFLRDMVFLAPTFSQWAFLVVATILAFILFMGFSNLLGIITFWLEDIKGVMHLFWAFVIVFSGGLAPLALLPEAFQTIAFWTPFRYFASFPIELYFGQLDRAEAMAGFAVCFAWIVVVHGLTKVLWTRGVRRYSAVGR